MRKGLSPGLLHTLSEFVAKGFRFSTLGESNRKHGNWDHLVVSRSTAFKNLAPALPFLGISDNTGMLSCMSIVILCSWKPVFLIKPEPSSLRNMGGFPKLWVPFWGSQ